VNEGGEGDGGSASLWVVTLSMILILVGVVSVTIALGFATHRRVSAAADLAALAGASRSLADTGAACRAADAVARANDARLIGCRLSGPSVVLVAEIDPQLRWLPAMQATARAGTPGAR
jgi:secretion/DNA translocation related TadE-like protein